MVVMAPVETVCTGGTLNPFWPIPPDEITGRSGGGGGGCTTGSWIVAVKTGLKGPAVGVAGGGAAFVSRPQAPGCSPLSAGAGAVGGAAPATLDSPPHAP